MFATSSGKSLYFLFWRLAHKICTLPLLLNLCPLTMLQGALVGCRWCIECIPAGRTMLSSFLTLKAAVEAFQFDYVTSGELRRQGNITLESV